LGGPQVVVRIVGRIPGGTVADLEDDGIKRGCD